MLYKSETDQEESLPFFCLYVYILSVKDCVFFTSHSLVPSIVPCVCVFIYMGWGVLNTHGRKRAGWGRKGEQERK